MPNMKKPRIVVSAAVGVVAFLATALWPRAGDPSYPDPEVAMVNAPTADSIALFHARATANPNALDLTILAQLQARFGPGVTRAALVRELETEAIFRGDQFKGMHIGIHHGDHECRQSSRRAHGAGDSECLHVGPIQPDKREW